MSYITNMSNALVSVTRIMIHVMRILLIVNDCHSFFRATVAADTQSYGSMLQNAPEFRNPSDVYNMAASFGLNSIRFQPSMMRGLFQYLTISVLAILYKPIRTGFF